MEPTVNFLAEAKEALFGTGESSCAAPPISFVIACALIDVAESLRIIAENAGAR